MSRFIPLMLSVLIFGCGNAHTNHKNSANEPSSIPPTPDNAGRMTADANLNKANQEPTAATLTKDNHESSIAVAKSPVVAANESSTENATGVVLTVHFNGYRVEEGGQICVSLFDKPEHFPESAGSIFNTCKSLATITEGIAIPNLKMGQQYAVAAFHDKNMTKVMATKKLLGHDVPAEGFGFSNNPGLTRLGPPLFSEAAVSFDKADATIDITLNYLF